ncbi:MAG: cyclic nucleotide-binding domain-containing protein, partial [Rhodospirillales bacterium]|nr:cyclic nucleotide-binding domain-containing protein [Rhodospirillales bacterium]
IAVSRQEVGLTVALWHFFTDFTGGLALGFIAGRIAGAALPLLGNQRSAEMTLTLALPYLVYIVGERYIGVSGVIAVVAASLTLGTVARARISPANWRYLVNVWGQVAFWAGSLVFILASILVPRLLVDVDARDMMLGGVVVVAALVARALVLFLLLPFLSTAGLSQRISHAYKAVILWGGLRGAVTLALALAVTENRMLDPRAKQFVAVLATGFVLFTLFINGTTLHLLIRLLGLDKLSALNMALRDKVLALSLSEVRDEVQAEGRRYEIAPSVVRTVVKSYEARVAEVAAGSPIEESISDRDRITIGLVALANRERELILDHHGRRSVSPVIIEMLLRNAARMFDGARTGGRIGYNRAAREVLEYSVGFRFAHFLHRWLGLQRPLIRRLADRFEMLLVRRLTLQELKRFNEEKLKPLLGERVGDLTGEVLAGRLTATSKALDALRLQYPEYAEALERRFLRQSVLRLQMERYRRLFDEGLIGPELYDNLRRAVQAAEHRERERPRLDLGLNVRDLIKQLDLFSSLDARQTEKLCRLFRSSFAVPGERIIRKGDRGDCVYFISSGAVEVRLSETRIRLGRGDVVGEL